MGVEYSNFRLSKITSDKHGTWWAIGTKNQWFKFRISNTGRIRLLFDIKKGKNPYFKESAIIDTKDV